MAHSKQSIGRLVRGAMGEIKADLIITGGRFINVYSGEILDGIEVAVLDGRFAMSVRARSIQGKRNGNFGCCGLLRGPWFH